MSNPLNRSALSDTSAEAADQAVLADNSLAHRLRWALGEKDRDFAWLARETGLSTSALSDINTKGKIPRADNALRIANTLGVSIEWLLTGVYKPVYAKADDVRAALKSSKTSGAEAEGQVDFDLVSVSEIDLAYGMGGTFADVDVEARVLHFPRTWLQSITKSPPEVLTFAHGRGDSMQPTLQDGDIVLIDRSQRTVREQDAIWAFTVGDIAMIKRIRVRGETVHILSDNDRVPPDEAHAEEVNVVGRVIFIGRRL